MDSRNPCTEDIVKFCNLLFTAIHEDEYEEAKELFDVAISDDPEIKKTFFESLPWMSKALEKDLEFFMESDPAADSSDEVICAYPGYLAICYYRFSHLLYKLGLHFEARVASEHAHFLTGIDIHPAAVIGCPFFIDHGTGIVIGETTVIGNYVKIYQGVTLGALSLGGGASLKGVKRHPTIGNNVTIYSGASILGGDVTIGNNVVIGSNVFLLKSIPDNYRVTLQEPELVLIERNKKDV